MRKTQAERLGALISNKKNLPFGQNVCFFALYTSSLPLFHLFFLYLDFDNGGDGEFGGHTIKKRQVPFSFYPNVVGVSDTVLNGDDEKKDSRNCITGSGRYVFFSKRKQIKLKPP